MEGFAGLREKLLRAGIAPRHVRRYLRELSDHLADLTAEQRAAGHDEKIATLRARALLGDDAELAAAMMEQRGFRSLAARFPWAIFCLMPLPALVLVYALWVLIVLSIGQAGGVLRLPAPEWFRGIATILTFAANFVISPALAWALIWIARRQRLSLLWPFIAIVLIFVLGFQGATEFSGTRWTIQLHTAIPMGLGPSGARAIHWPTFLVQTLLLNLPLLWLLRTRRKAAA